MIKGMHKWCRKGLPGLVVILGAAVPATLAMPAATAAASVYPSSAPIVGLAATPDGGGYWEAASDGGVFSFGDAGFYGSMGGQPLNAPVVGIAATPDGRGYWEVASDGGVFSFGDAGFYGSMGGQPLNAGVVGLVATPDGGGYWEVASDGGVFSFGDAGFYGSMGGKPLNAPVVGIAATRDGRGYWLAAADGGVFSFGDARFYGSMGGRSLNDPVTAITSTPDSGGYWLAAADGGVFTFGDAGFYGSMGGKKLVGSVDGITATPSGTGYWLTAVDGGVFAFGNAAFAGRASYTPPAPAPSTAGQRAADLASGWLHYNYTGVNYDYWHAPSHPQYWCSDFATYVWQHAGIGVPTFPGVAGFEGWAQANGRFTTSTLGLQVGDVIFYASHVGVIVQVASSGSVTTADGDFGGRPGSQATFASTSHVELNVFDPRYGYGAAGKIAGVGLIG